MIRIYDSFPILLVYHIIKSLKVFNGLVLLAIHMLAQQPDPPLVDSQYAKSHLRDRVKNQKTVEGRAWADHLAIAEEAGN